MKFLFFVGSSIKHIGESEFSFYNKEQRFEQTLETIDCIRKKVPNSDIVLFECSADKLDNNMRDILKSRCELMLEFYDDEDFKVLYKNINNDPNYLSYGKSILESVGLIKSLNFILTNQLFSDCQRIFKLTGRYLLNNHFNIQDYQSRFFENKYIFLVNNYFDDLESEREITFDQNQQSYLYGSKGRVVTGLWSFDRNLYQEILTTLKNSLDYLNKMMQYTVGNDIEHALYRYLNKSKIVSINNLGLRVRSGLDGRCFDV